MGLSILKNLGGGGHGVPLAGHRLAVTTTAQYRKISGCIPDINQGGYGWGRIYPNQYLLDLYDTEKDTRYSKMYIHEYYYSDPTYPKYGQAIDPSKYKSNYINSLHPMSKNILINGPMQINQIVLQVLRMLLSIAWEKQH